jgi:hypothetical protein
MSEHILQDCESLLQESLGKAGASPYLAHHDLADAECVKELIREHVNGNWDVLGRFFWKYPHLAIWSAARALADNYGEAGNRLCYPPIGKAFGFAGPIEQDDQNWLLGRFRRAASRLGLPLPIPGEVFDFERAVWRIQPADCFFSQAGVAQNQAAYLADIFWRARAYLGDPSSEQSTNTLVEWEREAIKDYCRTSLGRIPKMILAGANGYHAHAFARLLENWKPGNRFEEALEAAMEAKPKRETDLNVRLLCVDAGLLIQNFKGNASFKVRGHLSNGQETLVLGSRLKLQPPWPAWVECQSGHDGAAPWRKLDLFGEHTRALVFNGQTGRLQARITPSTSTLHLSLGEIIVVAREPFTINDTKGRPSPQPSATILYFDLTAGASLSMKELEVALVPRPQPNLRLVHRGNLGHSGTSPFLAGISAVLLENPGVAADEGLTEFDVHLDHPAMPPLVLPCAADATTGPVTLDLAEALPETGTFGLMVLELRPRGSDRVLLRETVWHWPGLTSLDRGDGWFRGPIPPNWDPERSLQVDRGEDGCLRLGSPDVHPYLEASLVFRKEGEPDAPPLAAFGFPPPGLSLSKDSENGPRPLRRGERIALSAGDGTTLTIRTHDPRVRLKIHDELEPHSFDRSCIRSLTSGALATSGCSEIRAEFPDRRGHLETLLRIESIEIVRNFTPSDVGGILSVSLEMSRKPPALRVRAEGLIRGQVYEFIEGSELQVDRSEEGDGVTCLFPVKALASPDIYMCALQADFGDGWWRTLAHKQEKCLDWAVDRIGTLSLEVLEGIDLKELFVRLTRVINRRSHSACKDSIVNHVLPLWKTVGLHLREEGGWEGLLAGAGTPWADDTVWLPNYHPLELAPDLFEAPLDCFIGRDSDETSPGFGHIVWLGRLARAENVMEALDVGRVIPFLAMAYRNCFEVNQGLAPELMGFEFGRYSELLKVVKDEDMQSLWTPRQSRLSVSHHAWCCEQFADRLARLSERPSHMDKLAEVVIDAAEASRKLGMHSDLHLKLPVGIQGKFGGDAGIVFDRVPALLSLWARCGRTSRTSDLLLALFGTAFDPEDRKQRLALERTGQILRLAPELFGFYLLLWEFEQKGAC